jgi:hypothetical protein
MRQESRKQLNDQGTRSVLDSTTRLVQTSLSTTIHFLVSRLEARSNINWRTNIDPNRFKLTQAC